MSYDLTGEKISYTYGRVVQVVSGSYYDGFGNVLPIGTSSVVLTGSTAGFATTGSNTFIGNQIISGSIVVVNGITSSLNGTASYSNNSLYADTASYYNGSVISSSYALSSSYTNTSSYSNNSISASYTLTSSYAGVSNNSNSSSYSLSGSFSITASYALNGGSNLITGSTYPITSSWSINSLSSSTSTSSSYTTTSSYSNNSISASYSLTSSYSGNSTSASYALTASYYNGSVISSSYSLSSSYARTASYAENSATSSYCINPFPISGSLGYWGSFWDSTTQNNDSASNAMRLGVSDPLSNGVRIVSGSKIHFDHDGVYNVQFSAVFNKPNASSDDVNVWVVKNGNNLSDTNTLFSIAGQSTSVAAWNFVLSLVTGDELQLYWHSNSSNISILNYATQSAPSIPATPSLIVTATQVTNTQIAASASYAATSSYALNGGTTLTTGSTYPITSSWTNNSLTASSINFTASNSTYAQSASYSLTASYLTTTNNYTVTTLNINSSGSTSASTNGSLTIAGQNTKGGSNYHDFLYITNTVAGAVNPNKYFRQDNTGNFEIVNSSYGTTIFILTDSGSLQLPIAQAANVTQLRNTGAGIKISGLSLFDDGNPHIHNTNPNANFWINSSGSGNLIINGQSGATGGVGIGTSTMSGYVTINGGSNVTIGAYGYLINTGSPPTGTGGGTTGTFSITCTQRVQATEFDATSDERLKNIEGEIPLNEAVDLVNKIIPIKYKWKDGVDTGTKTGYSAQQVYKAGFDHLIGVVKKEGMEEIIDPDGFINPKDAQFVMNYEQVTPYHSKLIKHLLDTIEKLEERLKILENK